MKDTTHLRYLQTLTIAPTKGSVTIAEAMEVFGYLDPDFQKWGTNQAGADTEATPVDVLEMSKDGTCKKLFGSFGSDVRSLCLSQPQIVEFCRSHREHLEQDGSGTFFLFAVKRKNEEEYDLFVAYVLVNGGRLTAVVFHFAHDDVWHADYRRRLVVRQQTVWTLVV